MDMGSAVTWWVLGVLHTKVSLLPVQVLQQQRHKPALVEVEEGEDGRLVAAVSLPSHTFLGEWTGEVVTREELEERMRRKEGVKVVNVHVLGEGLVIDSSDREYSRR